MVLLQQDKITRITLAIYWPVLIIFAHIPVPQSVRSADVSDKSLHFLAYLVLTFLFWFSIKPNEKVNWRKIPVWIALLTINLYGAVDEVVQSFVGRKCDALDIAANFAGISFGLLLFTFLTFRPAALVITAIVIFGITNIAKTNLADIFPIAYSAYHFFAYAIFAILWLLNMDSYLSIQYSKLKRFIFSASVPICFLAIVRIFSIFLGRKTTALDVIIPVFAIIIVVGTNLLRIYFKLNKQQNDVTFN